METSVTLDERVYSLNADRKLSVRDMLTYFTQQGRMRVSDLHLKVGSAPVYRMDVRLTSLLDAPLQTKVRDFSNERMITMETCLAKLVAEGTVTEEEATKWANHPLEIEIAMRSAR